MPKPRIATVSLAGCFGCHMSLLDIDERVLELAQMVDIIRSPVNDFKEFRSRCQIGLIEGGCANDENVAVLEDFRRHCDTLVALGDCAINGCIPAMRNPLPLEDCLREAYVDGPSVHNPNGLLPNDREIPLLLDRVYPCDEVVTIDHHLPGCPPGADAIWLQVAALLRGDEVELPYELLKYD